MLAKTRQTKKDNRQKDQQDRLLKDQVLLNRNCLIDLDPRTSDILRSSPKKDAAQLRCILCIKRLVRILFELFGQQGLYLAPCFRFLYLMDDGIRIFRNAFFNIFQTYKNMALRVVEWVISYLFEHTGQDFQPKVLRIS